MRKVLYAITVALFLLALPVAARATYVSFDFRYSFDDSGGSNYYLQCIDAHTGQLLMVESPIASGTTYTMRIPKDNHDKILCIVKVFGGPTVGLWRIYPKQYYQGCGGTVIADLPDDTGACGDGAITGPEKCDTGGNAGCSPSSATPRCCSCDYCGCADAGDCPQVTGAQCGYGKCGPEERPVFNVSCYDCGTCIYGYRCVADPTCTEGENPVETAEASFSIDQDAVHGALSPGQTAQYFLQDRAVEVSYPAPALQVNGQLIPGPLEPGGVYLLGDRTWVGILSADPALVRFYLMDPVVLDAIAEEWRNAAIAADKTGQENRAALRNFLAKVVRQAAGRLPVERINLNVVGGWKYKAQSFLRRVSPVKLGSHCAPTLSVRVGLETLEDIFEEKMTVGEAIDAGLVTVRRR